MAHIDLVDFEITNELTRFGEFLENNMKNFPEDLRYKFSRKHKNDEFELLVHIPLTFYTEDLSLRDREHKFHKFINNLGELLVRQLRNRFNYREHKMIEDIWYINHFCLQIIFTKKNIINA